MARYDITLESTDVCSGSQPINLQGVEFTVSLKKIVKADPLKGQETYSLPVGDNLGIETPIFTVRGAIDVDKFSTTSTLWDSSTLQTVDGVANSVTLGCLYALWRGTADVTLKVYFAGLTPSSPPNQYNWRNYLGTSNSIKVIIDGIEFAPDSGSEGSHFINYTIIMKEVR